MSALSDLEALSNNTLTDIARLANTTGKAFLAFVEQWINGDVVLETAVDREKFAGMAIMLGFFTQTLEVANSIRRGLL